MTLLGALFCAPAVILTFLDNWTHRRWYRSWLWGTLSTSVKDVMFFSAFVLFLSGIMQKGKTTWPIFKTYNGNGHGRNH